MEPYDRSNVTCGILHFGVGRFHRAHEALYVDEILQKGDMRWGICGVFMLPSDSFIYEKMVEQSGVYTLIERDLSGVRVKSVRSIVELLNGHLNPASVFLKLSNPEIKIVTFTVTEAGYFFDPSSKRLDMTHPCIQHDLASPDTPKTLFGYLAKGLHSRRALGIKPFTVQSCDNIQGNGDMVRSLLLEYCSHAYPGLEEWISSQVTFPNSMVDRITPGPTAVEAEYVSNELHSNDAVPVTSESYRQWVIEDKYCNDRPDWSSVGVQLVQSVKPYEKVKVRLLNAGHSALGYAGHLAGFCRIDEVASNETFRTYLMAFFRDVSRTLTPPEDVDLDAYQRALVQRFANPAIEDQVLRICKDGSAKLPGFILPTLRELLEASAPCSCVTFVLAAYMTFVVKASLAGDSVTCLDDPEREKLVMLARSCDGSASAFFNESSIFGDLGGNAALMQAVQSMHDDISQHGVIDAIKNCCISG